MNAMLKIDIQVYFQRRADVTADLARTDAELLQFVLYVLLWQLIDRIGCSVDASCAGNTKQTHLTRRDCYQLLEIK